MLARLLVVCCFCCCLGGGVLSKERKKGEAKDEDYLNTFSTPPNTVPGMVRTYPLVRKHDGVSLAARSRPRSAHNY